MFDIDGDIDVSAGAGIWRCGLVFGVANSANIISMCLPDACGELLFIFLRERWGETWHLTQEG